MKNQPSTEFEPIEMKVILFDEEDIIRTSGTLYNNYDPNGLDMFDED